MTFRTRLLPVGISEISLDTANPLPAHRTDQVTLDCATGPVVVVDGARVPLAVTATAEQALTGAPVPARACGTGPVPMAPGPHSVSLAAGPAFAPVGLDLSTAGSDLAAPAPPAGSFTIRHWGATARTVAVDAGPPSVFLVRENYNAGWQARLGGKTLPSVQLDGWQQGFVLPAGAHGLLRLTFTPQRTFVLGLVAGLLAALAVLALACWPRSRRTAGSVPPPPRTTYADRSVPRGVGAALALLATVALAGWPGAVTLAALAAACSVIWGWRRGIPSWFPALALMVGAFVVASVPSLQLFVEANSDLTQLLCVAALAAVFVGDGPSRPKRLP